MPIRPLDLATEPGASVVPGSIVAVHSLMHQPDFAELFDLAMSGNLRGYALYYAFHDFCGSDGAVLAQAIRTRDSTLQERVNQALRRDGVTDPRLLVQFPPRGVGPHGVVT